MPSPILVVRIETFVLPGAEAGGSITAKPVETNMEHVSLDIFALLKYAGVFVAWFFWVSSV
jgi:hypothetical protein